MTKPSSFWMLMMIIIRLNLLLWLFRFVSSSSSLVFLEHFQKKASCPFQEYLNQKKWIFLPTLFFTAILQTFESLNRIVEFRFSIRKMEKNWKFYFSFIIIIAFILSKWEKIKQAMNE